ncbi:MAG: putative signal transducing protein [Rubricoccaceae bacterium]
MSTAPTYEGWIAVFTASTDYEADLVRDRLDEAGLPAVVLTHRDHAFNLNVGDLASARVMVPPQHETAARELLAQPPVSEADLEAAALSADVMAPDAHGPSAEAMLDSGIEEISLSLPDSVARGAQKPSSDDPGDPAADPARGDAPSAQS